jgi:hypothetical protein
VQLHPLEYRFVVDNHGRPSGSSSSRHVRNWIRSSRRKYPRLPCGRCASTRTSPGQQRKYALQQALRKRAPGGGVWSASWAAGCVRSRTLPVKSRAPRSVCGMARLPRHGFRLLTGA